MIQDIAPHELMNEYKPVPPDKRSIVFCFKEQNILVKVVEDTITFPRMEEFIQDEKLYTEYIYLFSTDEDRFYLGNACSLPEDVDYQWEPVHKFRDWKPGHLAFSAITAFQLSSWYENHKFCGACGAKTAQDEKERMIYCPECKVMYYPSISPAVIVAVRDKDRILLTKYRGRVHKRHALIAGFVEIGESIETTAKREVMEEAGLSIKNIQYYKSQPWGMSSSVLMGFFADLDGSDEITLDEEELAVGEWVKREDMTIELDGISLTNEMMVAFKEGRA